jgi:hypothetical protein
MQAYSKLKDLMEAPGSVIEFFTYPTIAALADRLSSGAAAAPPDYGQVQDRVSRQKAAAHHQAMRRRTQRR